MQGLPPDFPMDEIIERYRDPRGVQELRAKARATKYCAHPIFLRAAGSIDRRSTKISAADYTDRIVRPCGSRIRDYCEACSYLYFGDSLVMVRTGLIGGKGVPEAISTHPKAFLTLTAPSYGPVHAGSGICHPNNRGNCIHGVSRRCGIEHAWEDPIVGAPLCNDCFDAVGLIFFNAHISKLWDYTLIELRRELSRIVGTTVRIGQSIVRLEYLRVFELQRRGALHAHVILRLDDGHELTVDPPLGIEELLRSVAGAIPRVKLAIQAGSEVVRIAWGSQIDLQAIDQESVNKVARYLAKYLSKDIGTNPDALGEDPAPDHFIRLYEVAGEMARGLTYPRLISPRSVASLGFSGHIMSASRRFSVTRTTLANIRREFAVVARESRGEAADAAFDGGTRYEYDGRGWASEGDAWLVANERRSREEALKEVNREETE